MKRAIQFWVKPSRDDLEALFGHLCRTGQTVAVINAAKPVERHFAGFGPTTNLPLGNHCVAPITESDGREALTRARAGLEPSLQTVWHKQRSGLRLWGVREPTEDALRQAMKAADEARVIRPVTVAAQPRRWLAIIP